MLNPDRLRRAFEEGLAYRAYVATGTPDQRDRWSSVEGSIALTPAQRTLIGSFTRRINVVTLSGLWCGDCATQCPMLAAIEAANPRSIGLRFLDRDAHLDLAEQVRICGGLRVPTVLFANEDFDCVAILGDKTLSRLRAVAARKLGPACPLPGAPVPPEETAATLQDWVNEFERIHLLLRLSTKLRARYAD
jgi:hypothetical protein